MRINLDNLFGYDSGLIRVGLDRPETSTAPQNISSLVGEYRGSTTYSGPITASVTAAPALTTVQSLLKYGLYEHFSPLDGDHDGGHDHEKGGENVRAALESAHAGEDIAAGPPGTIAADVTVQFTGTIDPEGEVDTYNLSVVAGETYLINLYGSGGAALPDTFLILYDDEGSLVNFDDDGGAGTDSMLTFTAAYTGDYIIGAAGFDNMDGTGAGDYTVDVVQQPAADEVPDTFAGAVALSTNGVTYGFIDASQDVDTYTFEVVAGTVYTFELNGGADYNTDFLDVPEGELDSLLAIYDSAGNLVASNDDISFPGDISSRVSFIAEETGTYYLDALAYPDQTGGYSITAAEVPLADLSPLDALDWVNADNIVPNEDNIVYVYFGDSDQNFDQTGDDGGPMVTIDWNDYEVDQVMDALEEYEKILGFQYEYTDNEEEATFRLLKTESEQYGAYFFPQDPAFGENNQGVGVFNVLSGGWSFDQQQSLQQGGFSFAVILHEFGHAHGVAHPHDNGGGSDILLGVVGASGTAESYGIFDLNQGVYTVMSYNDAYDLGPNGPSPFTAAGIGNGWSGTLGAFDIAVLQQRYGIINDFATGDDVYELADDNQQGAYYETIWDTAGIDEIRYTGRKSAQIDLLAATIDYSPTGGGAASIVDGIFGGYFIAGGVEIENASGGSAADVLLGNDLDNVLSGNGGDDFLMGRGGTDVLDGGRGFDTASYADSETGVAASLIAGTGGDGDVLRSIEGLQGTQFGDTLTGSNNADAIDGLAGDDRISVGNGNDTVDGGDGNDRIAARAGADSISGGAGNDTINSGDGNDTVDSGDGNDDLLSGNGNDVLFGGAGNDRIIAGEGFDTVDGGAGNDRFSGGNGNDDLIGGAGHDTISGQGGDDQLYGDAGNDQLLGGVGNDYLDGGTGSNILLGGDGDDVFLFDGDDADDAFSLVRDYSAGDTVELFNVADAEIVFEQVGDSTLLSIDGNFVALFQNTTSSDIVWTSDTVG